MTELNSFLNNLKQKECINYNDCFQNLITNTASHTYYTSETRIPISEINQQMCKCIEINQHMMKPLKCKGDCKEKRPFFVIDLKSPEKADMIDDLKSNVEFLVYLGGEKIDSKTNRILSLCSVFHGAYAFIYIDQPNMPSEIIFSKRLHYFDDETRRQITKAMNPNGIFDGELTYKYGMAGII